MGDVLFGVNCMPGNRAGCSTKWLSQVHGLKLFSLYTEICIRFL